MPKGLSTNVLYLGTGTLIESGGSLLFNNSQIGAGVGGTKTYNVFGPRDNEPPISNFATLDTRNNRTLLDFTTGQSGMFTDILPEGADVTNGLNTIIHWTAEGSTGGNCLWGVRFENMTNLNIDTDSFGLAVESAFTTNATNGVVNISSLNVTGLGGISGGNLYRVNLYRGTGTLDTMTGKAELLKIEIRGN